MMSVLLPLSLLIGVTLGLLGGGGSILAVPLLTYIGGFEAKAAIAASLLIVGTTAIFALIPHAKAGRVAWKTGLIFASTSMVGAYGAGSAAALFNGRVLMTLFATMMLVTSLAMARGRNEGMKPREGELPLMLVTGQGLIVGGLTGLVGAGGGFLIVPSLVILGGMQMHRAVATSLLVIALQTYAAFAGHATHIRIDFEVVAAVSVVAVIGSFVGGAFSSCSHV